MRDHADVSGSFLSPETERQLMDQLRAMTENAAVELHEFAVSRAPVRTGKYRDSLKVEDMSQGPMVSYRVWSNVAYARFIRSTKTGTERGRSFRAVFTEDLGKPAKMRRVRLVADAARAAAEVLGG